MKATLLSSLILLLCFGHYAVSAQTCTREITAFNAAPGGYTITGTGLLQQSNENYTLSFDNAFGTQSGPDLHVYLAANWEAPSVPGNTNFELGELISNSGSQSYQVPSEVELGEYAYVLIHCKMFNHWWGGGPLEEINCVSSTGNPLDESASSIFPNPASGFITIQLHRQDVEKIVVRDILGNARIEQAVQNQDQLTLDINDLANGVFFVMGLDAKGEYVFGKRMIKKNY